MPSAAYTTRTKVESKVPPDFLIEALDDDEDGDEDAGVFATIVATVSDEIDGYLEGRYALPLALVPKLIETAALILTCEALYERRGYSAETDKVNPWAGRAKSQRDLLKDIRDGKVGLEVSTQEGRSKVTAVTGEARTQPSTSRLNA